MPKVLEAYEFKAAVGTHSTHDWGTLFDGRIYELKEGEDYNCKTQTMAMLARKNAKKQGKTIRIGKIEGGIVLQVTGTFQPVEANGVETPAAEKAKTPATPSAPAKAASPPPIPAAKAAPTPAAPKSGKKGK
jgi:hypothetical protein